VAIRDEESQAANRRAALACEGRQLQPRFATIGGIGRILIDLSSGLEVASEHDATDPPIVANRGCNWRPSQASDGASVCGLRFLVTDRHESFSTSRTGAQCPRPHRLMAGIVQNPNA